MKNINDLMNKIANNIEDYENAKKELLDEKKNILEKNDELKDSLSVLENAINKVKYKKIRVDVIICIIVELIYFSIIFFTNLLDTDALKIVTFVLTIDIVVQISRILNKGISNKVAKDYNYVDFYSLYQQYNTIKREIKTNCTEVIEIEEKIGLKENEISRLINVKDNIDIILNDNNENEIFGSKTMHNSLEKKYSSIL